MIFDRGNKSDGASNPRSELHKLKRQDLLELLLEQMRENDSLRAAAAEDQATIADLTALSDRLKAKLDDKDVLIDRLKDKLNGKDASIARFKAKLDDKDALLEAVYGHFHDLATSIGRREREHALLQIEDLFASHFLSQLTQHVEEPEHVEESEQPETVAEQPEVEAPYEPEPEEPELAAEPEPAAPAPETDTPAPEYQGEEAAE